MEFIDGRFQNTSGIGVLTLKGNGTFTSDRVWFNWLEPVIVRLESHGFVQLHKEGMYQSTQSIELPSDMPTWKIRD
jgi:hypothetical protein